MNINAVARLKMPDFDLAILSRVSRDRVNSLDAAIYRLECARAVSSIVIYRMLIRTGAHYITD